MKKSPTELSCSLEKDTGNRINPNSGLKFGEHDVIHIPILKKPASTRLSILIRAWHQSGFGKGRGRAKTQSRWSMKN